MLTGDSAQCAYYIGRECGMVAEAAELLLADVDSAGDVTWTHMGTTPQDAKLHPTFTTAQVCLATCGSAVCLLGHWRYIWLLTSSAWEY